MSMLLLVGFMLLLLVLGMPVGFAMGVAGVTGLYLLGGLPMIVGIASNVSHDSVSSYDLVSIPMFVLMAEFVIVSRIADELYDCMVVWVGRTRGGLAVATALAGAGFGAISGSSTVSAATLASTSLPAMVRHGYDQRLANGVVAISGTLSMLIPPSVALIIYSVLTDLSVAQLLIAGVVPGIIVACGIILTIWYLVWRDPALAPAGRGYSLREKLAATRTIGPMVLLILLVTVSIYTGLATPTEAAGVGAFGAFLIAAFRGLTLPGTWNALANAARTTAMIMTILIGAHLFGYALTLTRTTQSVVAAIGALDVSPYLIITLVLLMLLVLGFFMDQLAIMILTVPVLVPLITSQGFDPIWFGVIFVIVAEVGMISPPVGMNVFVIARYTGRPVEEVFSGVTPHIVAHILMIILFVVFPGLILWLPSTM